MQIIHAKGRSGTMESSLFTEWMYNGRWMGIDEILNNLDEELNSDVEDFSLPTNFQKFYERNYKHKYKAHYYF